MHLTKQSVQERSIAAVRAVCIEFPLLAEIAVWARSRGGALYIVGGWVRDMVLERKALELDVEVHGVSLDELLDRLSSFGMVAEQGVAFGVLKIAQLPIDWSIPRRDSSGRHPAVLFLQQNSLEEALRRRDVTMNAMAISVPDGAFHDPFHGLDDMAAQRICAPDVTKFVEDPLRLFRVMQFVGRFDLWPDAELNAVCRTMSLAGIAHERIAAEFAKLLAHSRQPARGIRWLAEIGRLAEIVPELHAVCGVPQNPAWHPEGDVFEHTMQALDAAQEIALREGLSHADRTCLQLAALCHDVGKATTTCEENGIIRSRGHDEASVIPTRAVLRRITLGFRGHEAVVRLVRWHMEPGLFVHNKARPAAYKRLAARLAPVTTIRMLALLAEADKRARVPAGGSADASVCLNIEQFSIQAQAAGVFDAPEPPLITGKELCELGVPPGPRIGELVRRAYELQMQRDHVTREELWRLLQ